MLNDLENLCAEVTRRREQIETQSTNINGLIGEKQAKLDQHIRTAREEIVPVTKRWANELNERRKLFNTLQERRGNIGVFCRVRPSKHDSKKTAVSFPDNGIGENRTIQLGMKSFEFDQVFQPSISQREVYDETAGVVQCVVDGHNVCVFIHG